MNWRKRYEGPQPGSKVKIIGTNCASYYKAHPNEIFTLKHQYIKNGIYVEDGDHCSDRYANYWDTEEDDSGIEERSFKVIR